MQRQALGGKIHGAIVTECRLDYHGSLTIDENLMDAANILPGEKVLIANMSNGARLESYAMVGPRGSGVICLNGAAAWHGKVGDKIIIMTFLVLDEKEVRSYQPKVVHVDSSNKLI